MCGSHSQTFKIEQFFFFVEPYIFFLNISIKRLEQTNPRDEHVFIILRLLEFSNSLGCKDKKKDFYNVNQWYITFCNTFFGDCKNSGIWKALNLSMFAISNINNLNKIKGRKKWCITCHMLCVTCHLWSVTNTNSYSHRPSHCLLLHNTHYFGLQRPIEPSFLLNVIQTFQKR